MFIDQEQLKYWISLFLYKQNYNNNDDILIGKLETHETINNRPWGGYNKYYEFEDEYIKKILTTRNKKPESIQYNVNNFFNFDSHYLAEYFEQLKYFKCSPDYAVYYNAIYMPAYECLYLADEDEIIFLEIQFKLRQKTAEEKTRIKQAIKKKIKNNLKKLERIKIPLIYGGELFIKEYGHFLTEAFCRLWYSLPLENQEYSILIDITSPSQIRKNKNFIDIFYEQLSLDKNRFICLLNPVIIEQIIVPNQTMGLRREGGYESHKFIPENVAARVVEQNLKTTSQPLYLSRTKLKKSDSERYFKNEIDLENRLKELGCAIVYPETKSLIEQIQLINRHEIIIGITGSAMHNVLFDISKKPVVLNLTHTSINLAQVYIDNMKQADAYYISCLESVNHRDKNSQKSLFNIDLDIALQSLKTIGII